MTTEYRILWATHATRRKESYNFLALAVQALMRLGGEAVTRTFATGHRFSRCNCSVSSLIVGETQMEQR